MYQILIATSLQVIDRRVRELCVETEILPLDTSIYTIRERGFR